MAQIKHAFASAKADDPDSSLVNPGDWNADHEGIKLIRKTADETVNNSVTFQNDDHLLFTVAANEVWFFDGFIRFTTTVVADIKFAFVVPVGAIVHWSLSKIVNLSAEHPIYSPAAGAGASITLDCPGGERVVHLIGTIVFGGTAGNLQLRWAQATAEATNTQVLLNSWLKAFRAV